MLKLLNTEVRRALVDFLDADDAREPDERYDIEIGHERRHPVAVPNVDCRHDCEDEAETDGLFHAELEISKSHAGSVQPRCGRATIKDKKFVFRCAW